MSTFIRKPFKYTFFYAAVVLIAVNFAFFLLSALNDKILTYLGLNPILFIEYKMYWQPISYMFVHANFRHIFSNMLGLLFFGFAVEKSLGSKEFLLLYFTGGIFSGLLSLAFFMFTGKYYTNLIGASGAVFSIMLAYAVIYPHAKIYIWGILPIPSPLLVILYAAIELFSHIYGVRGNVAHFTHLLGFAAAYLYFIIRIGINPVRVWKNAYFS